MNYLENYENMGMIYNSRTSGTIILKVKEKDQSGRILPKTCALKLLNIENDRLQRLIFKREIKALKTLNACDHIVKIKDFKLDLEIDKKHTTRGAILLEHIHGENLDSLNFNAFSQVEQYDICFQIMQAVEAAHNNSVLHRDIKPTNIMYNVQDKKVTLIDFGMSKLKGIVEKETTVPFYTPNYSAPEVAQGKDASEASDIYSIGAVMYKILFDEEPIDQYRMLQRVKCSGHPEKLKMVLLKMLSNNMFERYQNMSSVIEDYLEAVGNLTYEKNVFFCSIDHEKLQFMKEKKHIENNATMAIFINSYLKKQFKDCTAFYNEKKDEYIFTGKQVFIECYYDEDSELFRVFKISKLDIDRRIGNERRGIKVDGTIKFFENRHLPITNLSDNQNRILFVELKNNSNIKKDINKQDELFDKLFGKWEEGLEESVKNEKERMGKLFYSSFKIQDQKLYLTVEKYMNRDIEELKGDISYLIEGDENYDLGFYEDTLYDYDEQETVIVIEMYPYIPLQKIKSLLEKKKPIIENFQKQISSYKKQLRAIHQLKNDDYSSRDLKDILLSLDKPTATPYLSSIDFSTEILNASQRQAIQKALFSDNISLIQGPPGTGKTKVIKEIIWQIINKGKELNDAIRVLVVSQSHTAVDNIVEGLIETDLAKENSIIRIGRDENISEQVAEYCTLSSIRKNIYEDIKEKSIDYMKKQLEIYDDADSIEQGHWKKIKSIHEDWIKRCSGLETLDYQIIKSATIIAGTCVGYLSNSIVKELDFDYVIIDESAKATTPELLVSIINSKKIVLVGDHHQLPAFADSKISPIIAELTKKEDSRLFDLLFKVLPDTHKQVLTIQYRMKKAIGDLISHIFYGGKIATGCDDKDKTHNILRFQGKAIVWINTSSMKNKAQKEKKGGSFVNYCENLIIKNLLAEFNEQNILSDQDIGIITGYKGQKELIQKTVSNVGLDRIAKTLDINTLDAFQGRENDIIIYSTVRTKNSIGFQKEKERVNVAFSRAKKLLIICGDLDFFYHFEHPDNKYIEIIDYIRDHSEGAIIDGGEIL